MIFVATLALALVQSVYPALVTTNFDFHQGVSRKCSTTVGTFGGRDESLRIFADRGVWSHNEASNSSGGFCTFLAPEVIAEKDAYEVRASFWNSDSEHGSRFGHNGFAVNWHSTCHFDFVYFRMHTWAHCLCVGSVRDCQWSHHMESNCKDGYPPGGRWYDVKVNVLRNAIEVYKKVSGAADWVRDSSFPTRHNFNNALVPRSALLIPNGYANVMFVHRWSMMYAHASTKPTESMSATLATTDFSKKALGAVSWIWQDAAGARGDFNNATAEEPYKSIALSVLIA